MITIDHVTRRFGRALAVDDVSLSVERGDSLALWGVNGAGKTTLIRCVLGLFRFQGRINVDAHDVWRDGKAARQLVGYVPQEIGFYDDLGVDEAIRFFAQLKGLHSTRSDDTLAAVGLTGHQRKRIRELSGGMKQRLALAIALLGDPPLLVLDEVTASLDAVGREDFVGLLHRLSGSGRTLLFASHRLDEVATLARRVAVLDRGRLTSVSPTGEFVAQMSHSATLHLTIAAHLRAPAMQSLRQGGFTPELNGVGVLVAVTPTSKAAPFRVLADARIPVDDFELMLPARPPSQPAQDQEGAP